MIRILKIHGRTAIRRRERLARVEAWMGEAGWRLGDFAEEAHSAMFERPADAPPLPFSHATRWLPGPRALAPREWLHTVRADPRLAGGPAVVLVLLVVGLLSWLAPHSFLDQEALKQQSGEQWRIVDANQLNVREAPSARAQQVGVLYRNQRVLIEGEVNDEWVRIAVPTRGYVAARFLKEEAAADSATKAAVEEPTSQPTRQQRPLREPSRPEPAPEPPQPTPEPPQPAAEKTVAAPEPPQPAGEKAGAVPAPPQPAADKQVASPIPPAPSGREETSAAPNTQPPPLPPGAPSIPAPPSSLPGSFPTLPPPPLVPSGSQ